MKRLQEIRQELAAEYQKPKAKNVKNDADEREVRSRKKIAALLDERNELRSNIKLIK